MPEVNLSEIRWIEEGDLRSGLGGVEDPRRACDSQGRGVYFRVGKEAVTNGCYPRLVKSLGKLFRLPAMIGIYSISILLWYVSWLTIGDRNWWLVLLNRFPVYLFELGLFLGIVALLTRRRKLLLPLLFASPDFHSFILSVPASKTGETDPGIGSAKGHDLQCALQ